jgi:hypothetical protein
MAIVTKFGEITFRRILADGIIEREFLEMEDQVRRAIQPGGCIRLDRVPFGIVADLMPSQWIQLRVECDACPAVGHSYVWTREIRQFPFPEPEAGDDVVT